MILSNGIISLDIEYDDSGNFLVKSYNDKLYSWTIQKRDKDYFVIRKTYLDNVTSSINLLIIYRIDWIELIQRFERIKKLEKLLH